MELFSNASGHHIPDAELLGVALRMRSRFCALTVIEHRDSCRQLLFVQILLIAIVVRDPPQCLIPSIGWSPFCHSAAVSYPIEDSCNPRA